MIKYIISALALSVVFLAGFAHYQARAANRAEFLRVAAEQRASAAEQRSQALEVANTALQAHLDRARVDRDNWQKVAADLETKEGKDETLNPYLRALLDSLLPKTGAGDPVQSAPGPGRTPAPG